MTLTVGSLFAGIGGFDAAAERAGMEVLWQSENDKHASTVLEYHWPGLNRGDIHDIKLAQYKPRGEGGSRESIAPAIDVLVGGFP